MLITGPDTRTVAVDYKGDVCWNGTLWRECNLRRGLPDFDDHFGLTFC